MSTLAPPTSAKVVINTTKGPIEIELWAKETPRLCRQFLQNCLEKKYVGQAFHKIVANTLVEVEPLAHATSVYTNEFHSRIRFSQRGMIGAAKAADNKSSADSFFITLKEMPQFNNDYVVFGKVMGESIYNVVRVTDVEMESDETPKYPAKITDISVPIKYFDDLTSSAAPRETASEGPSKKKQKKTKVKLDFQEDEADDEPEVQIRMKSAHDVLNDKSLSKNMKLIDASLETDKAATKDKIITQEASIVGIDGKHGFEEETAQLKPQVAKVAQNQEARKTSSDPAKTGPAEIGPAKTGPARRGPARRDPTIDSDYDPNLDLLDEDNVDIETLTEHKFTSSRTVTRPLKY